MGLDLHWAEHDELRARLSAADYEARVAEYIEALMLAFMRSPEGEAVAAGNEFAGLWAGQFLRLALVGLGRPPGRLDAADAGQVVTAWFPAEVCLGEGEEAAAIIPELLAFWQFLGREHALPQAAAALQRLRAAAPGFPQRMQDASLFSERKRRFLHGEPAPGRTPAAPGPPRADAKRAPSPRVEGPRRRAIGNRKRKRRLARSGK